LFLARKRSESPREAARIAGLNTGR
jgi:hypothetical protein